MGWSAWIVTVSDRAAAGVREDASGPALERPLRELAFDVAGRSVVADDRTEVASVLASLCDGGAVHLVVTTGGTGLAPRDLTPEATLDVAHRLVPGLMELARQRCVQRTPFAALSRGLAAVRGRTLIVNLPGHPRAALETLEAIADVLGHAVDTLARPPIDCAVTGTASSAPEVAMPPSGRGPARGKGMP